MITATYDALQKGKKMNLLWLLSADIENTDCFCEDALYLPKGVGHTCRIGNEKTGLRWFKRLQQESRPIFFHFIGFLTIRFGYAVEDHSYVWLCDRTFSSERMRDAEFLFAPARSMNCDGILEMRITSLEESCLFFTEKTASPLPESVLAPLQSLLFPSLELCCEIPLYFKVYPEGAGAYLFSDATLRLCGGAECDFLSYFNSFSLATWRTHTNVHDISLYLDIVGKFVLYIVCADEGRTWTHSVSVVTCGKRETIWRRVGRPLMNCIVGFKIRALADTVVFGGGYATDAPAVRDVRLGVVITAFQREKEVKSGVARLRAALRDNPRYEDLIDITVVDNGRTLTPEDLPGATLLPNPNYGGTGGFTRGLMHYQRAGTASHCLFMDDDASCEPASIFRAVEFLRHARKDNTAIGGAMLSADVQFLQWEKGAWFEGHCRPLFSNLDLRNERNLAINELRPVSKRVYAAWWFMMFPLSHVTTYAFPFFVRGDDVFFSYSNDFAIVTLNGISSWQESFREKESPLTFYLDARSHVIQHIAQPYLSDTPFTIIKVILKFVHVLTNSYLYDSAHAVISAFHDLLDGTRYWTDNMDMSRIREKIKKKYIYEVMKDVDAGFTETVRAQENIRIPYLHGIIRTWSLNGHLLPAFVFSQKNWSVQKQVLPSPRRVFLRKKIVVFNSTRTKNFTLRINRWRFFANFAYFFAVCLRFLFSYKRLKAEYKNFVTTDNLRNFWKELYDSDGQNREKERKAPGATA
jgi:hypothetical protein